MPPSSDPGHTGSRSERWLSIIELSARLGVPRETLYHWRKHGYGPPGARFGRGAKGYIRYRLSAVEAWERAQERAEAEEQARRAASAA